MAYAFTDWEGTCLVHHGIKGQKWGVRRYQNPDGTLTELGKKHEQKEFYKELKKDGKSSFRKMRKNEIIQKRSVELEGLTKKVDALYEKANDLENNHYHRENHNYEKISDQERQKLKDLFKEAHAADDELHKQALAIADDLLGKYSNKKVNLDYIHKRTSADAVRRLLTETAADNVYREQEQKKQEAEEQKAFSSLKSTLNKGGSFVDAFKGPNGFDSDKYEKVRDHIEKKQSKLIDAWWNKKTTGDWRSKQTMESFDAEAMRYAKQAARNMGLPTDKETLSFLLDWFFNGDD